MILEDIAALIDIARSKAHIDKQANWSSGSITYLEEIEKEIAEVHEELGRERWNHLEDELGDVLWDYINLLINLEEEGRIDFIRVFSRAVRKYRERIDGISGGSSWKEVKERQKIRLRDELDGQPEFPAGNGSYSSNKRNGG